MNAYIFLATDMLYGYGKPLTGRIAGVYTSSHYPVAFKCSLLGNEITSLEGYYVLNGKVKIKWLSVAKGNIASYNVYRSHSFNGTFKRVNSRTIPAIGVDGSLSSYTDYIITPVPRDLYYKIEVVHQNGAAILQPDVIVVKATPRR